MEEHAAFLELVCRVGGEKLSSSGQSTRYLAGDFKEGLKTTYGIDISADKPTRHPPYICIKCHHTIMRASKQDCAYSGQGGCGNGKATSWEEHSRTDCKFCMSMKAKQKGGRPAKRRSKSTGRVAQAHSAEDTSTCSSSGMDTTPESITGIAASAHRANKPLSISRFADKSAAAVLMCSVCGNFPEQAIQSACCTSFFCSECICKYLQMNQECPKCNATMRASSLSTPSQLFCQLLGKWLIRCDFYEPGLHGCPDVVELQKLKDHVSNCPFRPNSTAAPIRTLRLSSRVEDVLAAAPSTLQGDIADQLADHIVTAKARDGRLEVKTSCRGKPQVYLRTTMTNVASNVASSTTVRRRASELERIEETVSGGTAGARTQEVAGLKRLSSSEQEELLRDAGLRSHSPASGSLLAIKADLSLPWGQVRKLKRWLRSFGVTLESERTAREFIASNVPQYLAKEVPMTRKNGEVDMIPMVFMPDLVKLVTYYLDLYESSGKLVSHDIIPADKIWLKLGGDHGGGSFKFVFQIANLKNPNSLLNTIPISIFEGQDTVVNLETALGMYREQVNHIQSSVTWKGRSFSLFLFGDYDFQTKMYGLSGSSGVRPCLHCLCPKRTMDRFPAERPEDDHVARSLEKLTADYNRFLDAGSVHSQAKLFNNVVRPAILPVPVENVIIPALHLDLGIFPWLFSAFEADIQTLDVKLAAASTDGSEDDAKAFKELVTLHQQLREKQEAIQQHSAQLDAAQQQLQYVAIIAQATPALPNLETVAAALQQYSGTLTAKSAALKAERDKIQHSIATLEKAKNLKGPCGQSIEPVLQANNIQRQAYHGGSFVGNHVHRALQQDVIEQMTGAPLSVIQGRCLSLQEDAKVIKERYHGLFTGYSQCTAKFSHCKIVTEQEAQVLEQSITKFLAKCRQEVVSRNLGHITPKLHLLESHVATFIKRFGVGLGLLAEQGSESIHARFNSLSRDYHSIPNRLQRLKAIAEQHLVATLPQHEKLRPTPSSRKRKAGDQ